MTRFVDRILAPLARLFVARGLLFPEVAERLKRHYVAAAKGGGPAVVTDSRISVMTGLQRRDIRRIDDLPDQEESARPPSHLSRLVAVWQHDAKFAGRDLPRRDAPDSFETLAGQIRRDVHPRTMLDALLASGTVSLTDLDHVRLERDSYQPLVGSEDQLDFLAANAGDFLAAATSNVIGDQVANFERAVHYNHLDEAAVADLERLFKDRQMELLKAMSNRAAELQVSNPGTMRFRAGGYFWKE